MKSSSEEGGDSLGRPSKGDRMIRRQQRKIKKQLKIVDKDQPLSSDGAVTAVMNTSPAAVTAAQRSSTASRMTVKGSQDIKGVGRVGDTKPAWQQD